GRGSGRHGRSDHTAERCGQSAGTAGAEAAGAAAAAGAGRRAARHDPGNAGRRHRRQLQGNGGRRRGYRRRLRRRTAALIALLAAAGCGGGGSEAAETETEAVIVTPENIVVAAVTRIESGPTISGTLQPRHQANVRAEVAGPVLETFAERGEAVARGAPLARLDDAALRDAFLSARSAANTAEQAAVVARRNLERQQALANAGAVSESMLEDARLAVQSAESQAADARARLAMAQEQLSKTEVRSPIRGIVSERAVSGGDVVQPGSP